MHKPIVTRVKAMDGFLADPKYQAIVKAYEDARRSLANQKAMGVNPNLLRERAEEYRSGFSRDIQAYIKTRRAELKAELENYKGQPPAGKDPMTAVMERQDFTAKVSLMDKDQLMKFLYSVPDADDYSLTVLRDAAKTHGIEPHFNEAFDRIRNRPAASPQTVELEESMAYLVLLDHPNDPRLYTPQINAAGRPTGEYHITSIAEITQEV